MQVCKQMGHSKRLLVVVITVVFVAPTIADEDDVVDEVEGSSNDAEDIIEVDDVMASNKVIRKF